MFCISDYIKHQLSLSFWNLPATKSNDIKESSFCMIAHRLFFLRDTCWSVQPWICTNTPELYDFNVASVFDLSCSPGWSSSKISSENYTNTAESISNESGVLIPHAHCLWSANIAFSVVQTRRAASINTPKIWYLHWNKKHLQKKITKAPQKWKWTIYV